MAKRKPERVVSGYAPSLVEAECWKPAATEPEPTFSEPCDDPALDPVYEAARQAVAHALNSVTPRPPYWKPLDGQPLELLEAYELAASCGYFIEDKASGERRPRLSIHATFDAINDHVVALNLILIRFAPDDLPGDHLQTHRIVLDPAPAMARALVRLALENAVARTAVVVSVHNMNEHGREIPDLYLELIERIVTERVRKPKKTDGRKSKNFFLDRAVWVAVRNAERSGVTKTKAVKLVWDELGTRGIHYSEQNIWTLLNSQEGRLDKFYGAALGQPVEFSV